MVSAAVKSFARADSTPVTARLSVDGNIVAQTSPTLEPNQPSELSFRHVFDTTGEASIEVTVQADQLVADDSRFATIRLRDSLNVLLVSGFQSGRSMGDATDYVRLSLEPVTASEDHTSRVRTRVVSEGELTTLDVSLFDCNFLCNVGVVTRQDASFLTRYVQAGGSLVLCLGNQVQAASYNQFLWDDGAGILPAKIVQRVGNAAAPVTGFQFDVEELDHPLVAEYRGNPGYGLETALTFEYFKVDEITPETSVALRYENSDPCLLERSFGNGKCILVTTAGDDSGWCTWNTTGGTFATLMNEIVQFGVKGNRQTLRVGDAIAIGHTQSDSVRRPDGSLAPVRTLNDPPAQTVATYTETDSPGIYRFTGANAAVDSEWQTAFAVNVDPQESDSRTLSRDDFLRRFPSMSFRWNDGRTELSRKPGTADRSNPITISLLILAGALLLVEQVMAWRFTYGLTLLVAVLVLIAATPWIEASTYAIPILLSAVILAGMSLARRRLISDT